MGGGDADAAVCGLTVKNSLLCWAWAICCFWPSKQIDWKYRWTLDFDPTVGRKKGDVEAPKLRELLLGGMMCIGI